ncbi:MAG: hypothetical protein AAFX78_05050 [Cyanobacteria bacterium J06638_20]
MSSVTLAGFGSVEELSSEVKRAKEGKLTGYSLRILAGKIKKEANRIDSEWLDLPDEEKAELKALVYSSISPTASQNFFQKAVSTWDSARLVFSLLQSFKDLDGVADGLSVFIESWNIFLDAVLAGIERENLVQCDINLDKLDISSLLSDEDAVTEVDPSDVHEWLKDL